MRVIVINDNGKEALVFETDGSNFIYPIDVEERNRITNALINALRRILNSRKGMLDGEI